MRRALVCLLVLAFGVGCQSHQYEIAAPRPSPVRIAPPTTYADSPEHRPQGSQRLAKANDTSLEVSGALAGAPAVGASSVTTSVGSALDDLAGGSSGGNASSAPPPVAAISIERPKQAAEMLDIEANVTLEVKDTAKAVAQIRALVVKARGQVVNEVLEDRSSGAGAALSLRVPVDAIDWMLEALPSAGKVLVRKLETKDIGRQYHDAGILLRNLEAALKRYEELLAKANTPSEILEIERELSRVRSDLDRVKGDMAWMRDRAARATVYVSLQAEQPSDTIEPTATFMPGLRATSAFDLSGEGSARSFVGGGISARFIREFTLELDWLTRARNGDGVDLFVASLNVALYSELLGGGERRFLNPYLGFSLGFARLLGDNAAAPGGVLGLELYKSEGVVLAIDLRGYGFVGLDDGAHAVFQPALAANFAY